MCLLPTAGRVPGERQHKFEYRVPVQSESWVPPRPAVTGWQPTARVTVLILPCGCAVCQRDRLV